MRKSKRDRKGDLDLVVFKGFNCRILPTGATVNVRTTLALYTMDRDGKRRNRMFLPPSFVYGPLGISAGWARYCERCSQTENYKERLRETYVLGQPIKAEVYEWMQFSKEVHPWN